MLVLTVCDVMDSRYGRKSSRISSSFMDYSLVAILPDRGAAYARWGAAR
jgi:hypothetical protein